LLVIVEAVPQTTIRTLSNSGPATQPSYSSESSIQAPQHNVFGVLGASSSL